MGEAWTVSVVAQQDQHREPKEANLWFYLQSPVSAQIIDLFHTTIMNLIVITIFHYQWNIRVSQVLH